MACNYFLVRCDGLTYASEGLYIDAIAKGGHTLVKLLAGKKVACRQLLGEFLYSVTDEQLAICKEYNPVIQDFDETFKHFNIVSKETVRQIKEKCCQLFPRLSFVITVAPSAVGELFKYRQASFFKVCDYKETRKYAMVPKMAAVRICGRLYVALNAVDVRVEAPIIVTVHG